MISTEIRINGTLQIRLTPGDGIDKAVLDAMVARSELTTNRLKLVHEDGVVVVSVEAK